MTMPPCELSILMPCLNEAETLAVCIQKAQKYLRDHGIDGEVLIGDNGSTDGSQQIARDNGARVVDIPMRGYGAALWGGIVAARGRFVIMGDADDSYDFSRLQPFVDALRQGADLVMGNRFKGGVAPGAMPFLHRWLGNPVLSLIGRVLFKVRIGDFHCGLRGFSRERIMALDLQTTGMEFASEMVVRSGLEGYTIVEVPTTLAKDGRSRPPHLRTWRDGWRHLRFLLMYSPRWLFVYTGLGMIGSGLILALFLLPGPTQIAKGVSLDIHSFLVACIAMLLGFQSITFGFLARQYGTSQGFLPAPVKLGWFMRWLTLEHMLQTGVLLLLAGLGGFGWTIYLWGQVNFGNFTYPFTMRLLILSLTFIASAVQIGLTGFLAGIMQIKRR